MFRGFLNMPLSKKKKKKLLLILNIQKLHNIPNIEIIVFVITPGHISLFLGLKKTTNLELTIFHFRMTKLKNLLKYLQML